MTTPAIRPQRLPAVPASGSVVTPFPVGALPPGSDVHFHVHHHYAATSNTAEQQQPTVDQPPQMRFPWTMADDDDKPEPAPTEWDSTQGRWDRKAEAGGAVLLVLLVIAVLTTVTLATSVYGWVIIPALRTFVEFLVLGVGVLVWVRFKGWW